MDEIIKKDDLPVDRQSEEAYLSIRGYVIDAQKQVYSAVNAAMQCRRYDHEGITWMTARAVIEAGYFFQCAEIVIF